MDDTAVYFSIGDPQGPGLRVAVLGRSQEACHDYWDGNWIDAEIQLRVGGFSGRITAALRLDEIQSFYEQCKALYDNLHGEACFSSMEDWLSMKIQGDGLGHFEAVCRTMDQAGIGNTLEFILHFDQSEIPGIVSGLETILQTFPIRGCKGA